MVWKFNVNYRKKLKDKWKLESKQRIKIETSIEKNIYLRL